MAEEMAVKAGCGRKAVNLVEEPVVIGAAIAGGGGGGGRREDGELHFLNQQRIGMRIERRIKPLRIEGLGAAVRQKNKAKE